MDREVEDSDMDLEREGSGKRMTNLEWLMKRMFGEKTPTAAELAADIENIRYDIEAQQEFIDVNAKHRRENAAAMATDEFRTVEKCIEDSRFRIERNTAKLALLEPELAAAVEREKHAELDARKVALTKRVKEAGGRLDAYEKLAKQLVALVEELLTTDAEVDKLKADLRAAGRWEEGDALKTVHQTYRVHPDEHRPEVREKRKKWMRRNRQTGEMEDVMITTVRDGKRLPSNGHGGVWLDAIEVEHEVVTRPASTRRGEHLPHFSARLMIPAARIDKTGQDWIWPKPAK